jgi:hypothetical protein
VHSPVDINVQKGGIIGRELIYANCDNVSLEVAFDSVVAVALISQVGVPTHRRDEGETGGSLERGVGRTGGADNQTVLDEFGDADAKGNVMGSGNSNIEEAEAVEGETDSLIEGDTAIEGSKVELDCIGGQSGTETNFRLEEKGESLLDFFVVDNTHLLFLGMTFYLLLKEIKFNDRWQVP